MKNKSLFGSVKYFVISVCASFMFITFANADSTTNKIDLGTLTWTYKTGGLFEATITDKKAGITNCYLDNSTYSLGTGPDALSNNQYSGHSTSESIYIKNTTYTDANTATNATTFKTAMNGVYLYYQPSSDTTATWTAPSFIRVATTKYVEDKFAPSVTELNSTMETIEDVVNNTIIQADRIGKLHTGKQTRPTDTCPDDKLCLLITEADGSLHWYPIEPGTTSGNSGTDSATIISNFLSAINTANNPNPFGTEYYKRNDGTAENQLSNYAGYNNNASGIYRTLSNGEWAMLYTGNEATGVTGVIYGAATCNTTSGTLGTSATSAETSSNSFTTSGTNCWCKMTGTGTNGSTYSVSGKPWVYYGSNNSCSTGCAYDCIKYINTTATFRKTILGI